MNENAVEGHTSNLGSSLNFLVEKITLSTESQWVGSESGILFAMITKTFESLNEMTRKRTINRTEKIQVLYVRKNCLKDEVRYWSSGDTESQMEINDNLQFRKYWLEEKDQYDGEEEQDVCDHIHALLGRGTKVRGRTLRRMDSRYWVPIIRS